MLIRATMGDLIDEAQGHIEAQARTPIAAAEYNALLESLAARSEVISQHLDDMQQHLEPPLPQPAASSPQHPQHQPSSSPLAPK